MRVAVIDIGTNSTRLLIAETDRRSITTELRREASITRLGAGVHNTGRLNEEAIDRTLNVIKDYARMAAEAEVDTVKAVATSAMRDAENAGDLLVPASEILKVRPRIIAGRAEARLTYAGVLSDDVIKRSKANFLVIDIGGGSTEVIFGDRRRPEILSSLPLGCVRLTEVFFASDPPPPEELAAMRLHVRRILGDNFSRLIGFGVLPLAVAGTATSLAAIELELAEYDREKVHRYQLRRHAVIDLLRRLASVPLAERREIVGLEPERADVIVSGAAILLEIMDFFDFDHVLVSEYDILDGVALSPSY